MSPILKWSLLLLVYLGLTYWMVSLYRRFAAIKKAEADNWERLLKLHRLRIKELEEHHLQCARLIAAIVSRLPPEARDKLTKH